MSQLLVSRRRLIGAGALGAGALALPAWARGADLHGGGSIRPGFDEVSGRDIALTIGEGPRVVQGRRGHAVAVNGSVPGPLVRLREGQPVRLAVTNTLDEDSSIHWHGLLLPFQFDGVPGVSFPGIRPGETFVYDIPALRQSGTYWWHSHSGLQEQAGHYGPIVVEPSGTDAVQADRDYVLLLSDFTPLHPHTIMDKLKKGEGYFNYQQNTWTDDYPLSGEDRRMWARMRMMATDILDVTGSTYTYLANGRGPEEGLEFLFNPGERVRLRVINGSAMTFFNVRIPGVKFWVVGADGQSVRPVEVEEFQIGTAETYDIVVEPTGEARTIVAESMDRSGMAVATLASRPGARAPVPPLRDPPLLTMADMGMNHGSGGMDHGGGDMAGMDHSAMGHDMSSQGATADQMAGMDMSGMNMRDTSLLPPDVKVGPGIDMVSMNPVDRMGDPGLGLDNVPHKVLTYKDLVALEPNDDLRRPSRSMEIHLTGNMERYMWSFDGRKFTAVSDDPIRFAYNERVRVKLVNDTMMAHPIHLHGHFFELVNGAPADRQPQKHTVIVQPGGSATFDLTADEQGDWAFHCHLLYHMHSGMFQIVTVAKPPSAPDVKRVGED
ncbi:copper resistance system multicopper oxidase [Tsuneonella suprasediminis]|uniref:Copper resistance system multicopper oxidase n=1 Tax=Tsuneonella suprasediminis TaxID=2306996 RepID=A0A419R3C8_9SPHN|nr:copper resistance system multicopper oxidase [Tsuneonella suprasediminis]MAM37421.1 copper-binding protein [Erythrobacter sp.]OYX46930.1 MAG: copper-binding protein [Sphingomonadales bacterium 32-64-22]RJX69043.1 copper resistance system multicopper oxidase [Tsuneonella suprasediminis]